MTRRSVSKAASRRKAAAKERTPPDTWQDWSAVPASQRMIPESGASSFSGLFENRSLDRLSQRELGRINLSIRMPGQQNWLPVKLWDFTSISFAILFEKQGEFITWDSEPRLSPTGHPSQDSPKLPLQPGDEIELRISISVSQEFQIWCQVKNMVPWKDGLRIGLRRMDLGFPQAVDTERRGALRLPLAPALALRARIKHPFIFGYWVPVQVSDINRQMGLSFVSQDSSILVFEGMELEIHFELAGHREAPLAARVAWVHATEANLVKFGVVCLNMDWKLHNGICSFLLFSGHWTPYRLREVGFKSRLVKNKLRFRTVTTMDDYAEVLYLRRDAMPTRDMQRTYAPPESMAGKLDGLSRILMVHHHEDLVGTVTFAFPNSETVELECQKGFPGRKFPVTIPPKTNLIEVSQLCIHLEYRGTDLLHGLFEHGLKHFLMSDRHWLLASVPVALVPAYLRIGFKKKGESHRHPGLNNSEQQLILAHRTAFLFGKDMNILVWNALFADMVEYLLGHDLVKITPLDRVLIRTKLLVKPVCRKLMENRAERAFRQHLQSLRKQTLHESSRSETPSSDPLDSL